MRSAAVAVVTAAAVVAAGAAGSAQAGDCGAAGPTPAAAQDVRTSSVSCSTAESVAAAHAARCDRTTACRVRGFSCRPRSLATAGTKVRCTRAGRSIRFSYGI